jgi:ATP-dependent Lon protease
LTPEDEEEMNNWKLVLNIYRCEIWFYFLVLPITAGRDKSIKLINDANAGKTIGVDTNQRTKIN